MPSYKIKAVHRETGAVSYLSETAETRGEAAKAASQKGYAVERCRRAISAWWACIPVVVVIALVGLAAPNHRKPEGPPPPSLVSQAEAVSIIGRTMWEGYNLEMHLSSSYGEGYFLTARDLSESEHAYARVASQLYDDTNMLTRGDDDPIQVVEHNGERTLLVATVSDSVLNTIQLDHEGRCERILHDQILPLMPLIRPERGIKNIAILHVYGARNFHESSRDSKSESVMLVAPLESIREFSRADISFMDLVEDGDLYGGRFNNVGFEKLSYDFN